MHNNLTVYYGVAFSLDVPFQMEVATATPTVTPTVMPTTTPLSAPTETSTPTSTQAPQNTHSLTFNGSSQYFTIIDTNQQGLDLASDFTLECAVKCVSLLGANSWVTLVFHWNSTGNQPAYQFALRNLGGVQKLQINIDAGDGAGNLPLRVDWNPLVDTWYHIAIAYDLDAGTATFYVDGVVQGTATGGRTGIRNSSAEFIVGGQKDGSNPEFLFHGAIDEVRVWKVTRTATEIAANYDTEISPITSGLVSYWQFNGNYVDVAGSNTLTPVENPVFSSDTPF